MADGTHSPHNSAYGIDMSATDLAGEFLSTLPKRMAIIAGAIQERKAVQVRFEAHKLYGTASCYGFGEIADAAKCLIESVEKDKHAVADAVKRLADECRQALQTWREKHAPSPYRVAVG